MTSRIAPETLPTEPVTVGQLRAHLHAVEAAWHEQEARRSPKEKVAVLLRLQREVLPILRARRGLAPYEKPWPIDP